MMADWDVDDHLSWNIGSCSGEGTGAGPYGIKGMLINAHRCCLAPGNYTLTCKSENRYNWWQGYLEIQGRKYCHDYIGYKALRHVQIIGKIAKIHFHS